MTRPVPRLFLIRHGETEWSLNGRHTGTTDIPLTERGQQRILERREKAVGEGKLLDPANICMVFVSPRQRAHTTFHLLFDHLRDQLPDHVNSELVREWDYGDYEGMKTSEIRKTQPGWDIFKDGCPGGESVDDITFRIDTVISKVREHHKAWMENGTGNRDVVIVAHGHFNRCFVARWINAPVAYGNYFNIETSGITYLGYNHETLSEPSLSGLNLHAF